MDRDFHSLRSEEDRTIGCETHTTPSSNLTSSTQEESLTMNERRNSAESTTHFANKVSLEVKKDAEYLLSLCAPNNQTCEKIHSNTRSQESVYESIDEESFLQKGTSSNFINSTEKSDTASGKQIQVDKPDTQKTSHLLSKSVDAGGKSVVENSTHECPLVFSRSGPRCSTDEGTNEVKTSEVQQGLNGNHSLDIELIADRTDGETVSNKQSTPRFGCKKLNGNSSFKSQPHGTSREMREPIICDLCGKSFTQKGSLRCHKREVHDKVRPYFCKECGKSFGRKRALYNHKHYPTKETPFTCDVCEKSFRRIGALCLHRWTVHNMK